MTVDKALSLSIASKELEDCIPYACRYNWEISIIDRKNMTFDVRMTSPLDDEIYIIRMAFDDYRQKPLLIDFIDPNDGSVGSVRSYPYCTNDFFFHSTPCIFHPCSRKAYYTYSGLKRYLTPHDWEKNPEAGKLTNIGGILMEINSRISDSKHYRGRMSGP